MEGNLYCTYMNGYYTVLLLSWWCKSFDVRRTPGHVQLNSEILSSHVYLVLECNGKPCLVYSLKQRKTTCRVRQWWRTSCLSYSLLRTAICSVHSPSLTLTLTSGKWVGLALQPWQARSKPGHGWAVSCAAIRRCVHSKGSPHNSCVYNLYIKQVGASAHVYCTRRHRI